MREQKINIRAINVPADKLTREQMVKESSMQQKALAQLIEWRNDVALLALFGLILGYCGLTGTLIPFTVEVIGFAAAVFCIAVAAVLHRSICHGRKNVARIQKLILDK